MQTKPYTDEDVAIFARLARQPVRINAACAMVEGDHLDASLMEVLRSTTQEYAQQIIERLA